MLARKTLFPNVLELNFQLGQLLGCNVYLIFDQNEWLLVDIGFEENVQEFIELIRQLDFPLAKCKGLVATHADVDHIQGLAKAKQMLRTVVWSHPKAAKPLEEGDRLRTFARIEPQNVDYAMPPVKIDHLVNEGDKIKVGGLEVEVWYTPGHTDSQISLRLGDLLLCADNIYRDGCVGAIDAHHGSDIPSIIRSLERIRDSDVKWLLPSHGPAFRKDAAMINKTLARLQGYLHMADFGTCAIDWPLMDEWEQEIAEGKSPSA